jgi:hypothetical protein
MRQLSRKVLASAGLLTLVSALVVACTDFSHPPDALGHIQILVVDSATNAGVGSLPATLFLEDKTTAWRALITSGDGTGEFGAKDGGVIPGKFLVFLDLTGKGYVLAAGEDNYKSVRSVIGQTATVTFKLHKGIVTGPPGS